MKLYLLLVILLVQTITNVYSQNTLAGSIKDVKTKEVLTGATIYITDLKRGASADISGNYSIGNLPSGIFLIEVRFIGYASRVLKVTIASSTRLDVELEATVTEINELIVTGVSQATEVRQSPIPVSIIGRTAMLENSSTNLVDAISRQPGISQITTGGAISKPVIRGLGYNRIITLNNGLKQEGQQWGDEHGIEIDEYAVDRTEIIKGPGSLMYGSDGMAGVINFLAPKPVDDGKIIGNIQTNYQTNNGLIGTSLMTAGNTKGLNWIARVSKKDAHAYKNAFDEYVYNSGFNEFNYNAMIGLDRKWGFTHLSYSSFNQQIGMVEGNRDSMGMFIKDVVVNDTMLEQRQVGSADLKGYTLNVPMQQINHNRVALQSYFVMGKARLNINLAGQQNQRKEFGDPIYPDRYGLYFLLRTYTYDIKYFLPELKGFETAIGVNGMFQTSENKGREFLIPAYSLFDYGVFGITKKTIGKFNISGGLRYDQRNLLSDELYLGTNDLPTSQINQDAKLKFQSFTRSYSNLAGSLGFTYHANKASLYKLNVSRGFRAPNLSELAANGKHEGTLRYEYGNNLLKAETSLQVDLGFNFGSKHVTVDISLFQNRIQNFIYASRLSSLFGGDSIVDINDPVPSYQYRQGDAVLTGGEIAVDIHPHPLDWLHFENSFSYVQGINTGKPDSVKYLPFVPPAHYQSELRANIKFRTKTVKDSYVKIQYDFYAAQNNVLAENKTETKSLAYNLFNVGAGTHIKNKKGTELFSIYLVVNNIFNTSYQNHLSRIRYAPVNLATGRTGVYNMGRNMSFKIVIPLQFKN